MKKVPFRLTPYQVQWLLVVGFATVGYALYLRYLAIEFPTVALACEAGLQTILVLTGISTRESAERYPYRPTLVIDSIADLVGRTRDPFGTV